MRSVNTAKILVSIAAIRLMAACASGVGDEAGGLPSGRPVPSLGVVAHGVTGDRWDAVQASDFNYDGMADVLWNNAGTNQVAVWLMNGTQLLAQGPDLPGPIGDGWVASAMADFNSDGMADVLWNNAGQNQMVVWLMNGTQLLTQGPVTRGPVGDGHAVRDAGDFNSDGMVDVLWNNVAQNHISVWLMNGTQLLAQGPVIPGPVGDGWRAVVGIDFNYDGIGDVLWNNVAQNHISVWLMNGTQLLAQGPAIPGPVGDGWSAVTAADFNYDGMADVIWNNSKESRTAVWLMNGTQLLAPGPVIPGPIGADWAVGAAGDVDYDGMADAIWLVAGPRRRMVAWLMDGSSLLVAGPEIL